MSHTCSKCDTREACGWLFLSLELMCLGMDYLDLGVHRERTCLLQVPGSPWPGAVEKPQGKGGVFQFS